MDGDSVAVFQGILGNLRNVDAFLQLNRYVWKAGLLTGNFWGLLLLELSG